MAAGAMAGHRTGVGGRVHAQEVGGENRDVLAPLAQRRHPQGHHAQAIEEVLAKSSPGDQRAQIPVGGRDDPDVHPEAVGAADSLDLVLLEHPEQLGLDARGDLADLVEEARPGVRRLEQTALVDHGAGERALHMAEELGFEHAFGQRAAIDRHEWTLRPRARGVDGPRDQLFSRAGLTLDEHGAPGSGHARDHVEHVADRSRRRRRSAAHDTSAIRWHRALHVESFLFVLTCMSLIGVVRPATHNRRSGARADCRASRTETTE